MAATAVATAPPPQVVERGEDHQSFRREVVVAAFHGRFRGITGNGLETVVAEAGGVAEVLLDGAETFEPDLHPEAPARDVLGRGGIEAATVGFSAAGTAPF